jgi:hypothetical protein
MKPLLPRLDIFAVNYCNFTCSNCLAYCRQQINREEYQVDDYIPLLKKLLTYADIKLLHIVGGEPTLHSNLEDFVIKIRNTLKIDTQLEIISNGWWMPNEDKFGNIWSKIDKLGQGIHPQLLNRLSLDNIRECMKRIRNKYNIITDLYLDASFSPLCFTDIDNLGITEKCRFSRCVVLLTNGKMLRCGSAAMIPNNMSSIIFNQSKSQEWYNINTGDEKTLKTWMETIPSYCRYCTGDTIKVPHFGYNTEVIQEYKYPRDN